MRKDHLSKFHKILISFLNHSQLLFSSCEKLRGKNILSGPASNRGDYSLRHFIVFPAILCKYYFLPLYICFNVEIMVLFLCFPILLWLQCANIIVPGFLGILNVLKARKDSTCEIWRDRKETQV